MTAETTTRQSNDETAWVARFERLLARQIELCHELTALSESQRAFIDGDDPDALMGVLSTRQGIIDRLRSVAEEAAPLRERWGGGVPALHAELIGSVRGAIATLTGLMKSIAERDAEDRKRMDRSRDRLAGRLAGVARSQGAIAAYAGPRNGGPRYQDREG